MQHDLLGKGNAANGKLLRRMLAVGRMHAVAKAQQALHVSEESRRFIPATAQLNRSARLNHFSISFAFGFSGVPGWMISAGQRSAAVTISRKVPALASLM